MAQLSSGLAGQAKRWAVPLLLLAEVQQFTFYRNQLGDYASPIVLYLTSVALCFATGWVVRHEAWPPWLTGGQGPDYRRWWPAALALLLGLGLCFPVLKKAIEGTLPQDYSDIIPAITVYCQRLLAGETVHRPLTEDIGYFLEPGYLPATWFPFVIPEYLRFDYRWLSSGVLVLGLLAYVVVVVRLRRPAGVTFGLSVLPLLFAYAVLCTDGQIFTITLEPLVVGYYMLLLAAVLLPSRPLVVVALVLCLLSRFSLLFWVPLYLGLLYTQESRRLAWGTAGLVLAGVVLLYVVPVLSHDWGLFMRVQKVYTETALGEWKHLNGLGQPMHLYNGLGLTNLVFHNGPTDVLERLKLAKMVHLGAILTVVAGTALYYWRQRRPRTNYRVFAVIALKLYLATFYALLQVPYSYLAVVGFFASFYLLVVAVGPTAQPAIPAGRPASSSNES